MPWWLINNTTDKNSFQLRCVCTPVWIRVSTVFKKQRLQLFYFPVSINVTSTMPPSSLVLLCLLPAISLAEVTSFEKCPQFFVGGISPTVLKDESDSNRYEQICQCLLDQNQRPEYFYATLYDTRNKIPVYSAYEFQRADVDRDDRWYVEPQVRASLDTLSYAHLL